MINKVLYELSYELNNRPDWLAIPLRGLFELLGRDEPEQAVGPGASPLTNG
jgi:maltose alpha-D-glucosyltransferase / alpha-amylase